jgi:hypothetical protein
LEWNDYLNTDFVPTHFQIYRAIRTTFPTSDSQFGLIATVPRSTRSYTDEAYATGDDRTAWYRIKAYRPPAQSIPEKYSLPSNTEKIGVEYPAIGKSSYEHNSNSITAQLLQNHPNPFNPSTIISYELPAKSFVTLKVYNVLGKEITTLVSEYLEQGLHEVEFTAGNELPSGIYFNVITANEYKEVKKMILLR